MKLLSTLPALSAKALILDLLRMVHPVSMPISLLIRAGEVLDINENAIRVNTTRLLTRKQIKQDERGYYGLGKEVEPIDEWLRDWQKGEQRVKPWDGSWLLLSVSRDLKTKQVQALERFAKHLGFRTLIAGVLIRPNNLQQHLNDLSQKLIQLSGVEQVCLSVCNSEPVIPQGKINLFKLWDVTFLEKQYQEIIEELNTGIKTIEKLSVQDAFKHSYYVGAEVHYRLALDPLLPKEFLDTSLRQEVITLFEHYDRVYRPSWVKFFKGFELKQRPNIAKVLKRVS